MGSLFVETFRQKKMSSEARCSASTVVGSILASSAVCVAIDCLTSHKNEKKQHKSVRFDCKRKEHHHHAPHTGPTGATGTTGPTGSTGPPGPSSSAVYVYVYNTSAQNIAECTMPATSNQLVNFNSVGPVSGITFNGTNTLTLPFKGDYEATYNLTGTPLEFSLSSFKLLKTPASSSIATTVPGSIYSKDVGARNLAQLCATMKFSALAGDKIQLANNTNTTVMLKNVPTGGGNAVIRSHTFAQGVNVGTLTTLPIAVLAGSSIYMSDQVIGGPFVTAVNDSEGNAYIHAASSANGLIETGIWYTDNISASASFTVTITLTAPANVTMQVAEITGAAYPSLDTTGINAGTGLFGFASVVATNINDLGIMTIVTANNVTGTQSFAAIAPDFIIDASPVPAPAGQTLAGANLGQTFAITNTYTMSSAFTGNGITPIDWAAAIVSIRSNGSTEIFCEVPLVNASLDIILLAKTA